MLLSLVPDTHGRSAAGVSHISTGHAAPTTTIARPPAMSWPAAASGRAGSLRADVEPPAPGGPARRCGAAGVGGGRAPRRRPQPGHDDAGHDEQRDRHLRLEAETDRDTS